MRPRPEGRGEPVERSALTRSARGFNAATTRRPWRTRPPYRWNFAWSSRFNAATTRRPWRTAVRRLAETIGAGFNAATTRRPWRTPRLRDGLEGSSGFNAATTRRPWRTRGATPPTTAHDLLQCGHDPKAVENVRRSKPMTQTAFTASMRPRPEGRGEPRTGRPRPTRQRLQCGHDPKAVENIGVVDGTSPPSHASMRPRPEGRGEPRRQGDCAFVAAASMRPRPEGRGERRPRDRHTAAE